MPSGRRGTAAPTGYRERALLPLVGAALPPGPVLFDTNVFIHALTRRRSQLPAPVLDALHCAYVAAPTLAELSWLLGRLDPDHPNTAATVGAIRGAVDQIAAGTILTPTAAQWLEAGTLAGRAARAIGGAGKSVTTATDRQELIADAITALLARDSGCTVVTEDADFDVLTNLVPGLSVLFYDRVPPG